MHPYIEVELKTRSGELVKRVFTLQMGRPDLMPEILQWGDRLFIRHKGESFQDLDYREGLLSVAFDPDEITESE